MEGRPLGSSVRPKARSTQPVLHLLVGDWFHNERMGRTRKRSSRASSLLAECKFFYVLQAWKERTHLSHVCQPKRMSRPGTSCATITRGMDP